jgi:hypothetical protein
MSFRDIRVRPQHRASQGESRISNGTQNAFAALIGLKFSSFTR